LEYLSEFINEFRISIRDDRIRKSMEMIDIIVIKMSDLFNDDHLYNRYKMIYLEKDIDNDENYIEFLSGIINRDRKIDEKVHDNN
jgi:hypothetical protein